MTKENKPTYQNMTNDDGGNIELSKEIDENTLCEFLRFSHELVAKKFNTMVVVNGLFFSVFNVLNIQGGKLLYFGEKFIISFVGICFSILWTFNIGRSIYYTKIYKNKVNKNIFKEENDIPKSIIFWGKKHQSRKIVLWGAVAQIILWEVIFLYVVLSHVLSPFLPIIFRYSRTEVMIPNEIITLLLPLIVGLVTVYILKKRELI